MFKTISGKLLKEPKQAASAYELTILGGLQGSTYRGSRPADPKVQRRRARNKVARRQRKINAHR